jgi:hypothetical protein
VRTTYSFTDNLCTKLFAQTDSAIDKTNFQRLTVWRIFSPSARKHTFQPAVCRATLRDAIFPPTSETTDMQSNSGPGPPGRSMMTTYRNLQMIIRDSPPESERKPGSKLMSYQWLDANEGAYLGYMPITLSANDPFTFYVHDYTKTLTGPKLIVQFEPFPGGQNSSPFSARDTADLRGGVAAASGPVAVNDYNVFSFGPFTLENPGVEFEFSLEIDDDSKPPHKWFVDPQMIVEEG